jgi:hypothetical protein
MRRLNFSESTPEALTSVLAEYAYIGNAPYALKRPKITTKAFKPDRSEDDDEMNVQHVGRSLSGPALAVTALEKGRRIFSRFGYTLS